ncbi:(Fe-S)-binding protein [Streptomyces sp. NBC_01218]|uniref:(Fe-S)-binding protein n=1 Tax=unclassified Streptomyces TaxID=2593676 RepID=UPI0023B8D70F|nr:MULTISPECIES: (Fe-S)-binding protein [unclassified Streptomyces]WEH38509.1 (Fe-S)-binding protein [Streptomyces sp. AM 2-1-1]WSQ50167.1 (Fe-S)-binding protein [Streptomyces sp. NBC_01218]
MRVGLFATCLGDTLFPEAVKSTAVLLARLGHEIVFPPGQTCCGQMHVNTGYQREPLPLVRNFADQFGDASIEAVVMPSGSCAGSVRHQHRLVAERYGDAALRAGVATVEAKTYELSEFLVDVLDATDVGGYFPHRVTYHPTCHSLRMLRVGEKPLRLLRAVDSIDLVELPEADACCGFGGTFALKNAGTSSAMLQDKIRAIGSTGADVCTAGDSSCLMHIGGGLHRISSGTRTLHLAQILAATRTAPYPMKEEAAV